MGFTHIKSGENDDDDETVITDKNDWTLPRVDIAFEEYVSCDKEEISSKLCTVNELIEKAQNQITEAVEMTMRMKKLFLLR